MKSKAERVLLYIVLIGFWISIPLGLTGCLQGGSQTTAATATPEKGAGLLGNGFAPGGAKWEPVSQDTPDPNGVPIYVSRIPIPSRDAWLYRCVSATGGVALVVVPDDNIPAEKKK